MNKKRIEVFFLRGRDTGEVLSRLPGMHEFYRAAKMKKFFANFVNFFTRVCGAPEEDCDDEYDFHRRELFRRTGYVVC